MIVFKKITIKNFIKYNEVEIDLENKGLILIEGNNGVGKSLIGDAISWCCFDKTLRGCKGDEVLINTKKETIVLIELFDTDKNAKYFICRTRTKGKTILEIHKDLEDISLPTLQEGNLLRILRLLYRGSALLLLCPAQFML